jgi:hypothetical protein
VSYFQLHRTAALRNPRSQPRRQTVQTTYVDADALRVALQLADGDRRRLQILDQDNVLVLNRPRRRTQ